MRLLAVEDERKTATHLASHADYDLIILDVMLPERHGRSVIAELRRAGKQTPVLFLTARDASEDGVSLAVAAPEALTFELDRTLFQRAVGNLIENSLAHTPREGAITRSAAGRDGNVLVPVLHTGWGIPAEDLPRVCDPFHRVDRARSKHTGGVGLGLAIVKSIATLHSGTLRIESELGRGTRVRLSFPQ
jgi:signal transduction histidine kinase